MNALYIILIVLGYILMGILTAAYMKAYTQSTNRDVIMAAAGWPIIWVISAIAFPLHWIFGWLDWLIDWTVDLWTRLEKKRFKKD